MARPRTVDAGSFGRVTRIVRSPWSRRATSIAVLAISFGALGWITYANWPAIVTTEWAPDPGRLIAAFALQIASAAIATQLWFSIAARLGATRRTSADIRNYAYTLLSRRLPGAPWHIVGRSLHYADAGLARRVGIGGSTIEWALAVATGVCVWLALAPATAPLGPFGAIFAIVAIPFVGGVIVRQRGGAFSARRAIALWTAYDLIGWATGCGAMYFLFTGLYPFPNDALLTLVSSTAAAYVASMAVVILPAGLGLREVSLAALTATLVPWPVAVALSIVGRALTMVADLVWATILLVSALRSADESTQ
ncbi:MAG: hypothetical protein EPO26_11945 [Chloroflexota bacterium]|nr:MAG: hypothetical protein EPO26_11945 [Chloroflexota bacterium]